MQTTGQCRLLAVFIVIIRSSWSCECLPAILLDRLTSLLLMWHFCVYTCIVFNEISEHSIFFKWIDVKILIVILITTIICIPVWCRCMSLLESAMNTSAIFTPSWNGITPSSPLSKYSFIFLLYTYKWTPIYTWNIKSFRWSRKTDFLLTQISFK